MQHKNHVEVSGEVVRNPEIKMLPSGSKVLNFCLLTVRPYTSKGEQKEGKEYHNIVAWSDLAEANQHIKIGMFVEVEGRLQTRSWDHKDGAKQYRTEIVADRVKSPSGLNKETSDELTAIRQAAGAAEATSRAIDAVKTDDINLENIPF